MEHSSSTIRYRKGGKALYVQIKELYRDRIVSGELKAGDKIESEAEIQEMFHVSRITARQAILDLEREKLVVRQRGKGTFVIWEPYVRKAKELDDYTWQVDSSTDTADNLEIIFAQLVREEAEPSVAVEFDDEGNALMYCEVVIQGQSEEPILLTKSYYAPFLYQPEETDPKLSRSEIHNELFNSLSMRVSWCRDEYSAQIPDQETRIALRISDEIPVLRRVRKAYDEMNTLLAVSHEYYRGDRYACRQSLNLVD